jgi:hypothetical protein
MQSCETLMKLLVENQIESRPLDRVDDSECGHGNGLKVKSIDEMWKRQLAYSIGGGGGGGGNYVSSGAWTNRCVHLDESILDRSWRVIDRHNSKLCEKEDRYVCMEMKIRKFVNSKSLIQRMFKVWQSRAAIFAEANWLKRPLFPSLYLLIRVHLQLCSVASVCQNLMSLFYFLCVSV